MRFALVNDTRTLPAPGLSGSCPACGLPVIPKCGEVRNHHWAHRGQRICDHWWEPRTAWHYDWQDRFPAAWQEVIRYAPSGEKHIADIRTPHGKTLEFQYSRIRPDERAAREAFYGDMAWVVCGTRLKRDFPRFTQNKDMLRQVGRKDVQALTFPEELFPADWLACTKPVFFDFGCLAEREYNTLLVATYLWCLLHGRVHRNALVVTVSPETFIGWAQGRDDLLPVSDITQAATAILDEEERAHQASLARANSRYVRIPIMPWQLRGRRRF